MFKKSKSSYKIILLLSLLILISCATDSDNGDELSLNGNWEQMDLLELEINNINAEIKPILLSTSRGIYIKNDDDFNKFGLQDKEVVDVVNLSEGEFIAAVQITDFDSGDTTLFKKNSNTSLWQSYLQDYGGEEGKYTWISTLTVSRDNLDVLFATGGTNIVTSNNSGESWELVFQEWGSWGFTHFLKFDPYNTNIIWAGGSNAIFEPTLFLSKDGGDSWRLLTVFKNVETDTYDIAIHSQNSNHVLAGLGMGIRKSIDNGETWHTVFNGAGIYTFTHSAQNPEVVYASGINAQQQLFFIASADFGDTWETIEFAESPSQIHVNDMVSVLEEGKEILYFGTNKGVYSYTFEE